MKEKGIIRKELYCFVDIILMNKRFLNIIYVLKNVFYFIMEVLLLRKDYGIYG